MNEFKTLIIDKVNQINDIGFLIKIHTLVQFYLERQGKKVEK